MRIMGDTRGMLKLEERGQRPWYGLAWGWGVARVLVVGGASFKIAKCALKKMVAFDGTCAEFKRNHNGIIRYLVVKSFVSTLVLV